MMPLQTTIAGIEKIKALIKALFEQSNSNSDFIITNLQKAGQETYYCLVIQQKVLKLAHKSKHVKELIILDLELGNFLVNGKKHDSFLLNSFLSEIDQILDELRSKQAFIYRGRIP